MGRRADADLARRPPANMILDDGGDATMLVLRGAQYEKAGVVPPTEEDDSDEYEGLPGPAACAASRPTSTKWTRRSPSRSRASPRRPPPACCGCTSSPPPANWPFPAINVNDSVTKSKFDNKYGCRHSLIDGINRGTDVLIGGKKVLICRLRRRRQGLRRVAATARGRGSIVTEIDPINALQALMDGLRRHDRRGGDRPSGHRHHHHRQQGHHHASSTCSAMKHQAILGNIGHFDNEIDMAALERIRARRRSTSSRRSTSGASPTATRSSCCPRAGC